jgi:hypothetical protein
MKRIMALAALVSVVALFAFTTQAAAQDGATASADPEYVSEAGTHTITVSGSGWPAAGNSILQCAGFAGVPPEVELTLDVAVANCDLVGLVGFEAPDGSFSQAIDMDIPADGLVILVGNQGASLGVLVIVHVGEMMMDDMGDDMAPEGETDTGEAPEGGAGTGFGGMAGSDGNSVAVPLAASIAAVVALGGATLVRRRNA